MAQLLSSKVVIYETEPGVVIGSQASGTVIGALGITERGPIGVPVLCTAAEVDRVFGGFTQDSDLRLALNGFFENGGSTVWVVRTVHYDDVTDPDSQTALRSAGALNTGTEATPAQVAGTVSAPFSLSNGDQLIVSVNGQPSQGVTFQEGVNVVDITAVTIEEVRAALEAEVPTVVVIEGPTDELVIETVAAGGGETLQVGGDTAAAFGLDTDFHTGTDADEEPMITVEGKDPGAYGDRLEIETRAPTSGETGLFDLLVIEDGTFRERYPNLSMDPEAERYIETIINHEKTGSNFIRVTDLEVLGAVPLEQTISLTGGDDGLEELADIDFIGSPVGMTGMHALDHVLDLSMLMIPGRATPAVHNAMVAYCEVTRDGSVFPVLDPPENMSATEIVEYMQVTADLLNLSEYGAIYWPRVEVVNPAKSVFGSDDRVVVPPSGIICGVAVRTDSARPGGIYDPPAGVDNGRMFGVLGFENEEVLEEAKRDLVYPKRINPLTSDVGMPPFIDGARTLKGNGNFPYIGERRGVIFIKGEIKRLVQFARHKNNTEGLRERVRRTITAFLMTQMNNGAFRSRIPEEAFFVDVSDEINTPITIFEGKLLARVGLATNKSVDWVVISLGQDLRAFESLLASS